MFDRVVVGPLKRAADLDPDRVGRDRDVPVGDRDDAALYREELDGVAYLGVVEAFSDADGEVEALVVAVLEAAAVAPVSALEELEELLDEPQPAASSIAEQAITAALALIGGDPF